MRKKDEATLMVFGVIAAIIIYIITLIGKVLTAIVDAIVYNKKPILIFISVGIGIYLLIKFSSYYTLIVKGLKK